MVKKITITILILALTTLILFTSFAFVHIGDTAQDADIMQDYVTYGDFGAVGNGKMCDFEAIYNAHNFANQHNLPVRAYHQGDSAPTFYIGNTTFEHGAVIKTDTHWGEANFIVDDREITTQNNIHSRPIFTIASRLQQIDLMPFLTNKTLTQNQPSLCFVKGLGWETGALVTIVDSHTVQRKFFDENRAWGNPNNKRDIVRVDKHGNIDPDTPLIWNFDNIISITATFVENQTLTVSGGNFNRHAHVGLRGQVYYHRGINVKRSNVVINGLRHEVWQNTNDNIVSYAGMIIAQNISDLTVKNSYLTGRARGNVGLESSYEILLESSTNVRFVNVHQINSITDKAYWGIMAGNDSKNIYADNIRFSRFDIHRQAHNVTVKNSQIGWAGILVTGSGYLRIENTLSHHPSRFVEFREDWGASWRGNVYILNCSWAPKPTANGNLYIIHIINDGRFDFGFNATMPTKIYINGLNVESERNLRLVNNFNRFSTGSHPISLSEELVFDNVDKAFAAPRFLLNNMTITDLNGNPASLSAVLAWQEIVAIVFFVLAFAGVVGAVVVGRIRT
jgi:hypothetical protein